MHEKLEKTFLSDIDLFSDEAEKGNEFKYQLRRRIREIKRTAKRRRKKKVRLAEDRDPYLKRLGIRCRCRYRTCTCTYTW
jgi:hypothetical protein